MPSYTSHPGARRTGTTFVPSRDRSSIYCRVVASDRQELPDPEREIVGEEVLLDANLEAEGHEFLSRCIQCVPRRATAGVLGRSDRAERFTIMIKDLVSGDLLPDQISDTAYGVAWAKNNHLFYTRADEAWRPYVVLRHLLGSDPLQDVAVVTESDERFWLGVAASRDDQWIVIGAGSKITSEFRLLSTDDPEGQPRIVAGRGARELSTT